MSPPAPTLRIAVLGSGGGTNFEAIAAAIDAGTLPASLVGVISDNADAIILERARRRHIPALHLSGAPFKSKLEGDAETTYIRVLQEWHADVVALAGFMRIIKPGLLAAFPGRILNIHPALLPAYPGARSWEQALNHGAKISGCTVHLVDAGTDTGPILVQRAVPVLEDDTPESLHQRIQEQEHIAYPEALKLFAEGRIAVSGRRVHISQPRK